MFHEMEHDKRVPAYPIFFDFFRHLYYNALFPLCQFFPGCFG